MATPSVAEIGASRAVALGGLYFAPLATALPTDATTALVSAYKGMGYIGSDGIVPTRDVSTDNVLDMNGDTVHVLQTDFGRTYQATFLQYDNADVKRMIFGTANVVETAASGSAGKRIAVQDKGLPAAHGVLVADVFSGLKRHREVAGDVQPTSVEIGALVSTAVRQYTVTFTVFKDSAGVFVYEYDDDGVPVA